MTADPLTLEGVVVRRRDYRESDRIIELLTGEAGRVALLARGGRASRKRFVGALDLFVSLRVEAETVRRGRRSDGLWSLKSAVILDARLGLRAELERLWRASYLVDCACALSPEGQEVVEIYRALSASLDALARGETAAAAAAYPRILAAAGLMPDLSRCTRCGARDRPLTSLVDVDQIFCTTCAPDRVPLGADLRGVLSGGECNDESVAKGVEDSVTRLVETHIGRRLQSRRFNKTSSSR